MTPCPACRRNNARHRAACMYCGVALSHTPTPTPAPSPPLHTEIPPDLDDLIRAAMSGQTSPEEVRAALSRSRSPQPAPTAAPALATVAVMVQEPPLLELEAMEPLLEDEPLYTDEAEWDALDAPTPPMLIPLHALTPLEPASLDIGADLRALEGLVQRARDAWHAANLTAAAETLGHLRDRAADLQEVLLHTPQAPTNAMPPQAAVAVAPGVSVTIPMTSASVSHTFSLFADCPARAEDAPRIARALEVDAGTAHTIAVCRHPRVVLRGEDRVVLEQQGARYREATRLPAAVIPREALLDIDLPRVVVGASGRRGFQLSSAPLWLGAAHDPIRHGSAVREPDIRLAVPGAVVIAQYRLAGQEARPGQDAWILSGETRVGVLDLHGPGLFLRIIEDITDLTGLPGHDVRSPRRSFRGFLERLALWFPQTRLLGPHICRPTDPPLPPGDPHLLPEIDIDAWPSWEEHTRLCRLLFQIP